MASSVSSESQFVTSWLVSPESSLLSSEEEAAKQRLSLFLLCDNKVDREHGSMLNRTRGASVPIGIVTNGCTCGREIKCSSRSVVHISGVTDMMIDGERKPKTGNKLLWQADCCCVVLTDS
jgi:hypothetical protein